MFKVTLEEFMKLVAMRHRQRKRKSEAERDSKKRRAREERQRERVLRPDQEIVFRERKHDRKLATCPGCDEVVDAELLHPRSGLCPVCHEMERWRWQ